MGADLVGYFLFGPSKIKKQNVKKAVEEVRKLGEEIEAYEELRDADEDSEIDESKFPRLKWVADMEGGWPFDDAIETLGLGDPEEEVDEIVEAWDKQEYRDIQSREVPGEKGMIALFSGDTSWGDGPEPGSAWYLFRRAEVLNILGVLGLK